LNWRTFWLKLVGLYIKVCESIIVFALNVFTYINFVLRLLRFSVTIWCFFHWLWRGYRQVLSRVFLLSFLGFPSSGLQDCRSGVTKIKLWIEKTYWAQETHSRSTNFRNQFQQLTFSRQQTSCYQNLFWCYWFVRTRFNILCVNCQLAHTLWSLTTLL